MSRLDRSFVGKWAAAARGLLFVAAWLVLNTLANLRQPARDVGPGAWFLLPSIDGVVLLALFALAGWRGVRVPASIGWALAVALLMVRLIRAGDGLIRLNYYRPLNLYLDLPLLPDLGRLLATTVPPPKLIMGAMAIAVGLALAIAVAGAAMIFAQRALAHRGPRWILFGGVAACLALTPLWPSSDERHAGLFGKSVVPLLIDQARYALDASDLRREKSVAIRDTQQRLRAAGGDLAKLRRADVFIFFIESYGATVFRRPAHRERIQPALQAFTADMNRRGLTIATGLLGSPTYGGGSWLAHATFAAGVTIKNGLEFAVLRQSRPPPRTLATFFRDAGYRTILAQPGTTRPWPEGEVTGFQRKYYATDFAYRGPPFGWATMPDQFVVDLIHRREVVPATQPLFIQYALVSSHAPWNEQAPVLDDWSRIGDGAVFHTVEPRTFPVSWQNLGDGGPAYIDSLVYDLQILARYIDRLGDRNALYIVLGDHQPPGNVTGDDPSPAVPVHLISADAALLDSFAADGFAPGISPPTGGHPAGMETFLPTFVARVSRPPSQDLEPPPTAIEGTRRSVP